MARSRRNKRSSTSQDVLKSVKAQRDLDRKRHFEEGGTLIEWMGGPRLVQRNQKRYRRPSPGSQNYK